MMFDAIKGGSNERKLLDARFPMPILEDQNFSTSNPLSTAGEFLTEIKLFKQIAVVYAIGRSCIFLLGVMLNRPNAIIVAIKYLLTISTRYVTLHLHMTVANMVSDIVLTFIKSAKGHF